MIKVETRFLKYVKIHTTSDGLSESVPTTKRQFDLGYLLVEEMLELGIKDAEIDENGYVMGTLPSNTDKDIPTIGLIAHMDTAPDFSGENVNPQIHTNYDGNDIILNEKENITMHVNDFPELKKYIGQTIITTDGTTLLGADNKAGIAEILSAIEYLFENPHIEHGTIKIGFTPDEEVGRGANYFDVKKFGADYAYTIDGGELGELEYENFNAASVKIKIQGVNIHPGYAKDKMINSQKIAMSIDQMLPQGNVPELTTGREGFYLLMSMTGSIDYTEMNYIIRDHSRDQFEQRKEFFHEVVAFINNKYQKDVATIEITDSYYNMKEKVEPVIHIVNQAQQAMESLGIKPLIKPIRGGTDGARLSFMGLPTPNIFTGGHNFHGRYEYIPVESMEKSIATIIKIIELSTK